MDWFLYDIGLRHEMWDVKMLKIKMLKVTIKAKKTCKNGMKL